MAIAMAIATGGALACSTPRSESPHGAIASQPAAQPPTARASDDARFEPEAEAVHGEIETISGQRVVRLWGTPRQMGVAHGRLLRTEILEIVDGYALDVIGPATLDAAGALHAAVADVSPQLREEVEGIVEGMEAAGGAHVPRLGRDLRPTDLLVLNAMTDLLAIGCSSVSAWGLATEGDPGLAGAPAIVRNLDWSDDPELLRNQVIFAFEPADPERQAVVSVAFAGYVGCLSCMNAAGVTGLFNMGYGDGAAGPTQVLGGFSPANLLLRDALERRDVDGDGHSTAGDIEALWRDRRHAGSYILHLLEPRRADTDAPARVLEVEADGVVTRSPPGDGELGDRMLAATNHLRQKAPPQSCSRYARIERVAAQRDHRFDRAALWTLGASLRLPEVVHTVLVRPEARTLDVWLRAPGESAASTAAPVEHTFATLVPPR